MSVPQPTTRAVSLRGLQQWYLNGPGCHHHGELVGMLVTTRGGFGLLEPEDLRFQKRGSDGLNKKNCLVQKRIKT